MPHLVILYTGNLDPVADMDGLARALADTLVAQRDEAGAAVFPVGGVRVLAYPAASAVLRAMRCLWASGFAVVARRKPQRYPKVSRGFATPPRRQSRGAISAA